MIDPDVRPARPGDEVELGPLEAGARTALDGARGGVRWLDEHPVIGSTWPDAIQHRHVFVAELAGPPSMIVGYLVFELAAGIATVDQVYVMPEARQLGFGDALLEVATTHARQLGARLLEGQALPGDRETKNLYERAGITARLITVSRALSDPSSSAGASR